MNHCPLELSSLGKVELKWIWPLILGPFRSCHVESFSVFIYPVELCTFLLKVHTEFAIVLFLNGLLCTKRGNDVIYQD